MRALTRIAMVFACLLSGTGAYADGDPANGKTAFDASCSACHTTEAGKNGFGPSLAGVFGRRSGSLAGYNFSTAMANAGLTWDAPTLDAFLTNTTAKVPGTNMQFAVPDPTQRANLIAYLETLGPAPAAAVTPSQAVPLITGPTTEELLRAADDRQNWLHPNKDYQGQRYVPSTQITVANAAQLRPVCIFRSTQVGATQTDLLVYRQVMYATGDESTVAINAQDCRPLWMKTWKLQGDVLSKANRGVALKDGRLIRGTPDGYLIALNMADGSLLWSRKIADAKSGQYLSAPPLIFEDRIIYGPAGADWGGKNWVGAFKLETGEPLWRFNLIPDDGEPGAETWQNPAARAHGGGSIWTPLALNAQQGVLYVPVGNPSPDFYRAARPGDNLYTNSVVALDVRTGKLFWFHQFGPADQYDRDLSQVSPLFRTSVGGKPRDLIAISRKDGLMRVLDRESHEQLYELTITSRTNASVEPTVEGVHTCPGLLGGMEWNGPAYSHLTHTLYVGTVDWCGTISKSAQPPEWTLHAHYYGGKITPDPVEQSRGWLRAVDAATGKERWVRQWPTPLVAGVTVTAGGVLFTGDLKDNFVALDANTGRTLYTFNTGGSVGGGVISYELKGKQYVAATSGAISGFFGGNGTSAVVIFALP